MSIWIETKLKESEIGKIPLDWSCTTLNKIADINPKPIKLDSDDIEVSFVGMADVSESAKLMNTTNRLYGEVKKGFTSFQDNDVLVAKITPCFENGKGALVSNLTNGIGFGSTEFHVIRAKEQKGCPEFIHHITTTHNFRVKGEMNMTGTAGQKRVGKDFIASYLIACPPFVEQQKIAEVLSTVDKKIDLIDQKIAETEKLKTGLMQKLFSEGIGVQDENGEWQPHTEFQKTPIGYLPEQWSIKSLEDVCKVKGGKRLPKGETLISEKNEHPYIRVSDMFMGGVALNDIQYVPEHVVDKIKNYTIGKNDLFISVAGTLGIVGKVPEQLDRANLTENADKLTDIKCNIDYMYYYLCSEKIQSTIDKLKTVGAQPKLALTRIKQFTFIEPSPKEQQKIATILSSVDQKLELLRTQKAETQQLKKGLMQKLLTGEWRVPVEETEAA
ncbi:restriction endonuclease subunit S [Vibrio parahaemolyticus]|uniref:restriction endonuclease subunit S n=1 Tax=Vibrio fluvialis TaxID=676 RepID=UPI002809758D|nr:restriction endonuclease subunit S [Vibrio parahaemolyticus]EJE4706506.1 restriction endonuclease subunit S [Vibrio parahaemolyticus]EJE8521947.1 restriction endonuclease subunit S [Vibrio parahaemolyticus]EJG0998373.1 restriction endonuclease subunit S [Vibrio parahaemolyticus]ELA7273832.1 restriction endonuclease subunit S [Vibrio parahaemolyticus]